MAVRRKRDEPLTGRQQRRADLEHAAGLGEQARKATAKTRQKETAAKQKHQLKLQSKGAESRLAESFVRGGRKPPPATAAEPSGELTPFEKRKRARQPFVQRRAARQQQLGKFRAAQAQEEQRARVKRKGLVDTEKQKERVVDIGIGERRARIPEFTRGPEGGFGPEIQSQFQQIAQDAAARRRQQDISTGRQALERRTSLQDAAAPTEARLRSEGEDTRARLVQPRTAEGLPDILRAVRATLAQRISQGLGASQQPTPSPAQPDVVAPGVGGPVPRTIGPPIQPAPQPTQGPPPLTPDQIQSVIASPNPEASLQMLVPGQLQQILQALEPTVGAFPLRPPPQPAESPFALAPGEEPMKRPDLFATRAPADGVGGEPLSATPEQTARIEEARATGRTRAATTAATVAGTEIITGQRADPQVLASTMNAGAAFDVQFDPASITSNADASLAGGQIEGLLNTPGLTPIQKQTLARNLKASAGYAKVIRAISRISEAIEPPNEFVLDSSENDAKAARLALLRARDTINRLAAAPGSLREVLPERR